LLLLNITIEEKKLSA